MLLLAEAIAVEAVLAVVCLRAQEGPVVAESTEGTAAQEEPAKKKDKKKGKGGGDRPTRSPL